MRSASCPRCLKRDQTLLDVKCFIQLCVAKFYLMLNNKPRTSQINLMIQCPGQMILCFNVASLLQNIYNNQGQNGIFFSFVYLNGTDDLIQTESQIFVPFCYFCMQPIILFLGLGSE